MERKKARITVIKRMTNTRVQELHMAGSDRDGFEARPCMFLKDGQTWVVGSQAPPDFCHWAWADIHADIVMIQCGGNPDGKGYIGHPGVMISSCCDGFNPVVFKIERLEEPC